MKFTLSWLKEHLDTNASIDEISKILTEIGLEIESIENKAEALKEFRAVEILEVSKHPNADKLNICKIKTENNILELVCGAPNVRVGLKAVLAPLNSIIPANKMKVKKAKIRGVESIGMLCSARELDLGEDDKGIIELKDDVKIGEKIIDIFALDDPLIEVAITPNRGDCLSVYGIARDLSATKIGSLKERKSPVKSFDFKSKYKANSNIDNNIINFIEIKNITNKESPAWLRARLESIGLKPKNAIVDITNYILFNYGQPLHAYDADKIAGNELGVSFSDKDQNITALDGKEYNLSKDSLVVRDNKKILAIAGIIGAENSVTEIISKNLLIEAANFSPELVTKMGRKLQIDTDSRYRFERGIDKQASIEILKKAAALIKEICGGEVSEVISSQKPEKYKSNIAKLNYESLNKAASYGVNISRIKEIFKLLGFNVSHETSQEIEVKIPSWRNDVKIEADLIEEILRIEGYSKIPLEPIKLINKMEKNHLDIKKELSIKRILSSKGLDEVINWSFYGKKDAKLFGFSDRLSLINPISEDLMVMRESLVPILVKLALNQQNKGENNIALFEYGKIFQSLEKEGQQNIVSVLRLGNRRGKEVNNDSAIYDVYDVKGDLFSLLENLGLNTEKIEYNDHDLPVYLHQNRATKIYLGKYYLGYFGELHPAIAKKIAIKGRVNIGELFLQNLPQINIKNKPYIQNDLQSVTRDFCFIIDKHINANELKKELLKTDKSLVKEVRIFDLYEGENLPKDKKSIALTAILQPYEKSLTGEELEKFNLSVITRMAEKFQAILP